MLRRYSFPHKSVRKEGGQPRKCYVIERTRLRDIPGALFLLKPVQTSGATTLILCWQCSYRHVVDVVAIGKEEGVAILLRGIRLIPPVHHAWPTTATTGEALFNYSSTIRHLDCPSTRSIECEPLSVGCDKRKD